MGAFSAARAAALAAAWTASAAATAAAGLVRIAAKSSAWIFENGPKSFKAWIGSGLVSTGASGAGSMTVRGSGSMGASLMISAAGAVSEGGTSGKVSMTVSTAGGGGSVTGSAGGAGSKAGNKVLSADGSWWSALAWGMTFVAISIGTGAADGGGGGGGVLLFPVSRCNLSKILNNKLSVFGTIGAGWGAG